MRLEIFRSAGRILGIYVGFFLYFLGVFALLWYDVPGRIDPSNPIFDVFLLSAGIVGLFGFSYLNALWRKQTRKPVLTQLAAAQSAGPRRDERFLGITKMGSLILGAALLGFGLVDFFYGLLLYGQKWEGHHLAALGSQTYLGPYVGFLTYIPEVTVASAVCVFALGIWMLVYSQS